MEKIRRSKPGGRDKANARMREWRAKHPEKARAYKKILYDKNRVVNLAKAAAWKRQNRAHIREYMREYMATHPNAVMRNRLNARLQKLIKRSGVKKQHRTSVLIGTTPDGFRAHIESLFFPGMTWENRRLWHIDHKRPCASFDLTKPEQQRACFHYTNLQPLWAPDNQKKGAKFTPPTPPTSPPPATPAASPAHPATPPSA